MNLPALTLPKIANLPDLSRLISLGIPIGSIAISLVIAILVTWPKFNQVLKLRSDNAQLVQRVASLDLKAQKLAIYEREKLEMQLSAAEQFLPSEKNAFLLIRQVEDAARASGVLLERMDIVPGLVSAGAEAPRGDTGGVSVPQGAGVASDIAPKIQLKMSVASDYKSLLQFINNVLNIPRVAAFGDFSISSSLSSGQAAVPLRTSLTINAYWQQLPKDLGSIESPINDLSQEEIALLEKVRLAEMIFPSAPVAVPVGKADLFAPF